MKQKKIGTTLYVFDTTAYQITEDTDATVIKIQEECIPAYAKLNPTLVSKFSPINYKLYCVQKPEWADYLDDYTVSVSVTGNGAVSASPTSGDEGEEITLTVTPESGYEINTLTAASGGTAITITDNKFIMPAGNVTVTATFQGQEFDITCAEAQYGSVSAPSTARLGDTVTITTTPDTNYVLDTLTVMCGDVPVTVTNNAFTMPAGNVTITATFVLQSFEITCQPATNGTVSAPASAQVGSTVTITTTPATGYVLDTLTAMCGDVPVIITDSAFTMPAGDVTITATFVQDVVPYEEQYFTIEAVDGGVWLNVLPAQGTVYSVSLDNGSTWTQYTAGTPAQGIGIQSAGDKALFKATGNTFKSSTAGSNGVFNTGSPHNFKVYGNAMSLIYGDNFTNQTSFPANSSGNFEKLFYHSTLTDASNLILPVTTLTEGCYYSMFNGCTHLTSVPKLPATTVVNYAYDDMFTSTQITELIMLATSIDFAYNNLGIPDTNGTVYVNPNADSTIRSYFTDSDWTVEDYTPSV